jgi:hypothetical protein
MMHKCRVFLTVVEKKHFCNIGICHQGKCRPDKKIQACKTTKYHGFISLALDRYLEDLNPFGSDRWSNSTIRLRQIRDGGPTR